jgi:hypothetical protein
MSFRKEAAVAVLPLLLAFGLRAAPAANPVHSADELVAQHLNSIADATTRAGLKSRAAEGAVHFRVLEGGSGGLNGKVSLTSEGENLQLSMKFENPEYDGEEFVFDGKKFKVAFSTARQTRSGLGSFVLERNEVLREGLLGGTLSTAWPLLNLNERKAKLKFNGLKKVDGQQLYELGYQAHGSDLEIKLYFDPETCHHVETTYVYTTKEGMVQGGAGAQSQQQPSHYRLQEKFSDFKTVDGFTLPTRDDIQLSQELQSGRTRLFEWELSDLNVLNNQPVDSRSFNVN